MDTDREIKYFQNIFRKENNIRIMFSGNSWPGKFKILFSVYYFGQFLRIIKNNGHMYVKLC